MNKTRKNMRGASISDTDQRRPIASYAGKNSDSLFGPDVLACTERKIDEGVKEIINPSGLSGLIGPTKITAISAIANGFNYTYSISNVFGLSTGAVLSAIKDLIITGMIRSTGYYLKPGDGRPPKHRYELTDLGKELANFMQLHDVHFKNCVEVLKVKSNCPK